MIRYFAQETGPIVHIAPGEVGHIGGLTISNSMLYGWMTTLLIVIMLVLVARHVTLRPKGGLIQFIEIGVDFITNLVEGAFDNIKIARKFVPYFVTLFFFILLSNLLGLMPIVGQGFQADGHPVFRPFTGDLSGTLALGAVTMVLVYVASVRESGGFFNYIKHFFVGNPLNPLYLFIGLLEIFTDLTRVISLSLRLFLNVAIGEIVISVFSYLGQIAAPLTALPFFLLEILVSALQAYIFTILGVMYLAIAVNGAGEHAKDDDLTEDGVPETMGVTQGEGARG